MDVNKAFEVGEGFVITDGPFITGGTAAPTFNATVSTLYFQTNGAIWTNPGGLTWSQAGNSSSNDFDYYKVNAGEFVTISSGQQSNPTHLELQGCLKLEGCLIL